MREVEIKAHAAEPERLKAELDSLFGAGQEVHKKDRYFRRPGELRQSLRIRRFPDCLELTTKRTGGTAEGENNLEYEFRVPSCEYDRVVAFFHALGHEDYFVKNKDGWEWRDGDMHIELLSVNDLGYFLEIEILLPLDAAESLINDGLGRIHSLLDRLGAGDFIEMRPYRDMILERR